jgi:DNA-binding ferritin-like protein
LLEEMVDELAERIRSIGGKSIGTLIEFTDETRLWR